MGLDLTVGLHKTTENASGNFLKIVNDEDKVGFDREDIGIRLFDGEYVNSNEVNPDAGLEESLIKSINKYYRLNWSGVGAEQSFMSLYCSFYQKNKQELLDMRLTLKQARKKQIPYVLITGEKKIKIGRNMFRTVDVFEVLPLECIKRGKGSLLKVKDRLRTYYVSKAKLFNVVKNLEGYVSALSLIALGRWEGSNGEVYLLKHNNGNTITTFREICTENDEYDEIDNESEQFTCDLEEVLTLDQKTYDGFVYETNRAYNAMKVYVEKEIEAYSYVAKNNLTLLTMLKEFLDNKDLELSSYFG